MAALLNGSKRFVDLPSDLAEVETRSEREVEASAAGLEASDIDAIWEAVRRFYRTRTQPGITLAVRHRGELVLERAIGHARPGVLATPRTPFCTFSVSKAITAVLLHHLDAQDVLRLDDPVAEYVPEFARHGKDWVTLRHVLTHRAGIPSVAEGKGTLELLTDPKAVVAALCDAKPVFLPGRRLAYHAVTGGFVLDEVVRRVTGQGIDTLVRDAFARPFDFEYLSYGVPPERHAQVAENRLIGYGVPFPFSRVLRRAFGMPLEEAVAASNDPRWLSAVVPSGNLMATADDLARFFGMLLPGHEQGVIEPRVVRRLLVESAYLELDLTLGLAMRYGQGVMLGAELVSPFGVRTPRAFGHYGLVTMVGFADPERDLSVGLCTNGKAIIANQFPAFFRVLNTIGRLVPRA